MAPHTQCQAAGGIVAGRLLEGAGGE